ncbi:MAG: hypothetical protein FWD23_14135 [Oscillospiraceae bacterium]|nr:hypothetical protein [Oscillospiraceae bacterium]
MKKILAFILAAVMFAGLFALAACDGEKKDSSGGGGDITGETHDTGTFSVLVPKGWEVSPFYKDGEVEPNTLAVHKGTAMDYMLLAVPMIQFYFFPEGDRFGSNIDKAMYDSPADIEPVKIGEYTWTGFTYMGTKSGTAFDVPCVLIWTDAGAHKIQAAVWLELGETKITLEDADVQAILSSLAPK